MAVSMKTEHIGHITADGAWREIFRVVGRRHKLMHLIGNNKSNVTVSIRARESDDQTTWTSIYGAELAPTAQGVDLASISWRRNALIVEARGLANGQISLEEISAKEAYCSSEGGYSGAGTTSMWFEIPRETWCAQWCQTGSQSLG